MVISTSEGLTVYRSKLLSGVEKIKGANHDILIFLYKNHFLTRTITLLTRTITLFVFGCIVLAFSMPCRAQSDESQEGNKDKKEESPWYIDGYLDFRYRLQSNHDDVDQDLYQIFSLSFGESKDRWISGNISGRVSYDLDGSDRPDSFVSISDTHDRFYTRLNSAYIDLRPKSNIIDTIRIGRQWMYEVSEIVLLDGFRLETKAIDFSYHARFIFAGGSPEHLDESPRSQDRVYSMGMDFKPWKMTRITAFYTYLKDVYKQKWVDDTARISSRDDLLSFELRQNMFDNTLLLYGAYSNLNSESRDTRARITYQSEDGGWDANFNYRILNSTQKALSTELDPYYSVLRNYHPYQEFSIDVRRDLTDTFITSAGTSIRRVDKERDKSAFNHDFERYFLSGTLLRWPLEASEVTMTGNLYDADGDHFWEAEGSWLHDLSDELSVEAGTGYALYHEDRYTFEERNHVRSLFLRLEYEIDDDITLRGNYSADDDDEETTHRWEIGLQFRF